MTSLQCFNKKADKLKFQLKVNKSEKAFLGRQLQNHFKKSKEMSGKHLYIMLDDNNKLILKDNNSTNG